MKKSAILIAATGVMSFLAFACNAAQVEPVYTGGDVKYGPTKAVAANACADEMVKNSGLNCPPGTSVVISNPTYFCDPLPSSDPNTAWSCDCIGWAECLPYY